MSESLSRRQPITAIFACLLLAAPILTQAGCQNRAHTDLYQQRMAGEIRVLEDQLYEADYENRVLRDKVQQLKAASVHRDAPAYPSPEAVPAGPSDKTKADRADDTPSVDQGDMDADFDDELSLPMLDEGTPVDLDELTDPAQGGVSSEGLLPAPGGPEPPGKSDTTLPQVVPGEMLPPPTTEADEVKPPGQIKLDSLQGAAGVPDKLRIHSTLSGGQRIDGHVDGMLIVVNVVDKIGKTVDMDSFDIDAELSVVILDPERDPSEARLGRWDFSSQQVTELVRSEPISGLHIPVEWQDAEPSGDEVIVHIRLRAEDDEMRCEQRLKVERKTAIAEWTPRGEDLR